jgi:hypothetical protein
VSITVIVSVLLSSGYQIRTVSAANNYVANNFFNTAITGYWLGSTYNSPLVDFGKGYTEITEFYDASGGRYPVHMYVNQPRNITGMELYSTQSSKIKDASGNYLYYFWHQIMYEYEVIVYSEARSSDVLKTIPYTSDELSFFNFYYWNANSQYENGKYLLNNWGTLSSYPLMQENSKSFQISGEVPDPSDPGYKISGVGQSFSYELPATTFTMKLQMMLGGNGIDFDTIINDTANNSTMSLNGTSYYIGSPTLMGTQNGTSTGLVSNTILNIPTRTAIPAVRNYSTSIPELEAPALKSQTNNYVNSWVGSQDLQIGVEKSYQFSDGYAQTTFETSRPVAVYDDNSQNIVGIYEPDARMLKDANIDCFLELPIDFQPVVSWMQYQVSYRKLSVWMHRSFQVLWWGNELSCQLNEVTDMTYPKTFIESKEVHNMYYIQRIQIPVYVASIYNWMPKGQGQYNEPLLPPNSSIVNKYTPPTFTGDKNNTLTLRGAVDWGQMLMDFFFNPIFGILLGVVVVIGGIIAWKIFSIFTSPAKLVKRLTNLTQTGTFETKQLHVRRDNVSAQTTNAVTDTQNLTKTVYLTTITSGSKIWGYVWKIGLCIGIAVVVYFLIQGGGIF